MIKNAGLYTFLGMIALGCAAVGGWIANIVKAIAYLTNDPEIGMMIIARLVGIFAAPLGCVLGYF